MEKKNGWILTLLGRIIFYFFFDRQQEQALISTQKGGGHPTYTSCIHENKPNTPQTKKDHTNKTKQS